MEFVVYELVRATPLKVLPKLLEKMIEQHQRCIIHLQSIEQVEELNQTLWTYQPQAFLPHGSVQDGHAADQPIWLTDKFENPNQALVYINLSEPCLRGPDPCQKSIVIVETSNTLLKQSAHDLCHQAQNEGISCVWWLQNDQGGWERQTSLT